MPEPRERPDRRISPIMILLTPVLRIAQPGIAGEDQWQLAQIEANAGIAGRATMSRVMLGQRRNHDHIGGPHIPRPLGHRAGRTEQHPYQEFIVGGPALATNGNIEIPHAEREVVDADMREVAAQSPATELRDIEMRALDRFLQTFEAVEIKACDCEVLIHRHSAGGMAQL